MLTITPLTVAYFSTQSYVPNWW